MNITFLSDFCRNSGGLDVCLPKLTVFAGIAAVGLTAGSLWAGYMLGERFGLHPDADETTYELQTLVENERRVIADAKAEQRAHLDALALKIAELQAHLMRIDALGDRLVDVGKLDREEFDFSVAPPQGGVDDAIAAENVSLDELSADMGRIASLLSDREDKLAALEQMLMNRELMAKVMPSGRPIKKGWMSSGYGKRTDPFKGKKAYHRGVDFAGARGADVVTVASGVVVRSELSAGYGNVVEIRHADGYSTLYGHNQENLVKEGDMVTKGQVIALLGSTGRSTGPHVHFEVHRNGNTVNPNRFLGSR